MQIIDNLYLHILSCYCWYFFIFCE